MIEKHLKQAKELFLTDVDDETRQENLDVINDWEKSISENYAFGEWQEHDITKRIVEEVRKTYVDTSMVLLEDRRIDQATREKLWAKQDAILFMLSLMSRDVQGDLKNIEGEITRRINATK